MTSKKSGESLGLLVLSLLITVGILGILWFWLSPRLLSRLPQLAESPSSPGSLNQALADHLSMGERHLIKSVGTLAKQEGIAAFAAADYPKAVQWFEESLQVVANDPETLIYRNNALVNDRHRQNPNSPIYTIAVAAPLHLDAGINILQGVAQAQDVAVNQQGINLQVVIANDGNQPTQAQQIAEKLSSDSRILAVVGHYTSPNTCAALRVYSRNNLVVIAPTSTVVNLQSNPDCGGDPNHVFFRTVSTSRVEAVTLVQYLTDDLKISQPNVVVFYNPNELFSQDLFTQFEQALKVFGGHIITTVDLSDPNFGIRQLSAQVRQADALAVFPDGGTGNTAVLQNAIEVLQFNNGDKPILGANTLYLQSVVDQVGKALVDRLFVAVDWHPKQCGAAGFAKQINEYWAGDLNRRTALSYEAVQAVLQAISLDSSANANSPVTRLGIRQKLSETGIREDAAASSATLKGISISFDTRGDRREITTRAIVTVNDRLRFDLVKDVPCSSQP